MAFPITPEAIRVASDATGIVPVIDSWASLACTADGTKQCACGLSIMVAQKIGWDELYSFVTSLKSEDSIQEFVANHLGLTVKQVNSFVHGFDGNRGFRFSENCDQEAYFAGLHALSALDLSND